MSLGELTAATGVAILLAAFLLNAAKKMRRFTYAYNAMNLIGAALLVFYALEINALLFAVLEAIWLYFAAYFMFKVFVCSRPTLAMWNDGPAWDGASGGLRGAAKAKPKPKKPKPKKEESSEAPVWPWQQ